MKEDVLFKKTPFGGFDRVEVITYIQQLKETQQKYKVMIEDKDVLNKKLTDDNVILSRQVESLKSLVEEFTARAEQAEAQYKSIKTKYDMLEKKLEKSGTNNEANQKLAGETVKMCDELVETASNTAKGLVKKAEDEYSNAHAKIVEAANQIEQAKKMPAKDVRELLTKLAEEIKNG